MKRKHDDEVNPPPPHGATTKSRSSTVRLLCSVALLIVLAAWDLLPAAVNHHNLSSLSNTTKQRTARVPQKSSSKSSWATPPPTTPPPNNSTDHDDSSNDDAMMDATIENVWDKDWVSPACRPRRRINLPRIQRLYFSHTRKAGGTTLHGFLSFVAKSHGWTLVVNEGKAAEAPLRNDTYYVTNLRAPVARIVSSYKYEGRWICEQLVKNASFVPTPENSQTLEDYIALHDASSSRANCSTTGGKSGSFLWKCSENCYLRWFGQDFNCLQNPDESYRTAMEKLMQYHLIVVTERMQDNAYTTRLARMLNVHSRHFRTTSPWCAKESTYWNEKHPAVIQNETLKRLEKMNQMDMRLYNDITNCPNGRINFPRFDEILGGRQNHTTTKTRDGL